MLKIPTSEGTYLLESEPMPFGVLWRLMITPQIARPCAGDGSFKFLPYQLSTVRSWPTVVATGDGGLGLDPGEGA